MTPTKPNVLFVMADQLRHDYLGCAGASFVHTPNIDRLAARGTRFSRCCTNAPVCGPARISLATGLLPTRLGTTENNLAHMPISVWNHYRHFRDNGYRVEVVGRHDLSKPGNPASRYGTRPLNYSYGFTRALEMEGLMSSTLAATEGARGPYTSYLVERGLLDRFVEDFRRRAEKGWIIGASQDYPLPKEHHIDAFIGRRAVERIEQIEDDYPFYMLVSFQSPHDPYAPPSDLGEKHRSVTVPDPIVADFAGKPERVRLRYESLYAHATPQDVETARRQYCAKIELVDEQVGAILAALQRRGIADDTIVVFASDHGDHLGDHGLFIKWTAYEPSVRVPLIVAGPGVASGASDALIELQDAGPTLMELADLPDQPKLDARSAAAVVRGEASRHRDCAVSCQSTYRALRTDRYKYIETLNDRFELYDLGEDPTERRNIINEDPDTASALSRRLLERFTEHRWNR